MWGLKNTTPYAADRGWIRDHDGKERWVVAVKCTYDILKTGQTQLSECQEPVYSGPVIDTLTNEIKYETDLGAEKRHVDIILNGHAWAPSDEPVEQLTIGFKVGSLVRLARIYGNRINQTDKLTGYKTEPFKRMALCYKNMPAGSCHNEIYYNSEGRHDKSSLLPNIEFLTAEDHDIGFGVVAPHQRERTELAGTYDDEWLSSRYPLLPDDFNPLFWQVAPKSQQIKRDVSGGEQIMLANLTAPNWDSRRVIGFYLPKVSLIFDTHFDDGRIEQHRPKIHTIILEPDYPRFSVVWHGTLSCHSHVNSLKFTRIWEKKRINALSRTFDPKFQEWEQLCQ